MPLSAPPSILAAFTTIKITIPLSTWSVFYSHVALPSGASCTVGALLAPSPSSPASSPSLQGGFEERVILTSTAGRFRHNEATYGSHRRISSLRSSRRCPDSADRSSVEESRCRTEILSTDTVLLYFDPTAAEHGSAPLPSIERSFRRQSAETCFRTVRGRDRHIIGHDIARRWNQDDCRLKQATKGLRSLTLIVACQLSGVGGRDGGKCQDWLS
jgi:hypothetical protein